MQHIAQLNNAPEIYYDTLKFAICTAIPPNDHIGTYLLQEKSISETMLIKYFSDNQHLKNFELIFLTVSKHKCKNTLCRLLAINKQLKGSLITKTLALQGLKKSICHESTKMLTALLKDHYLCKLFTPTAVEEIFECTIDKYCRFVVSAFLLFNLFNEKTAQQAYASILKTNNPKFIDFICSHPKFRKLLKQ